VQLFFDLLFPALEVLDFIGENGLAHLDLHLKIIEVVPPLHDKLVMRLNPLDP